MTDKDMASKKVSFKVTRGFRINGQPVWPTHKGKGKDAKEVETVICVDRRFAEQMQAASKGEITKEKANFSLAEPVVDELDAFGAGN